MSTLLECERLSVGRGGRTVVHDVSLALHRGEITALLGPNGAGKSTLLAALAGTLPASEGQVTRSGRVAVALQSADLARRTVLANVELALGWWGVPRSDRATRAREALRALGVESLADRPAAGLSGGERRRVHLARVIAVQADVLLLDEPFTGVDARTRSSLIEDSVSVLRSPDRATLVVVHDRAEAWALADRLLVLLDGRLAADGTPGELLRTPPTPEVARFLGYDGELRGPDGLVLTRPAHVVLSADGPVAAQVTRVTPGEDGARLELQTDQGKLYAVTPYPVPRVGERVSLRLIGGARF